MLVMKTFGFFTILSFVSGENVVVERVKELYKENGERLELKYFFDKPDIRPAYDIVIVGSGPAGSAIANRLSAFDNWNILLIDKGPEANSYNDIPFMNVYTMGSPYVEINPVEESPNYCSGIKDGRCQWPEGNGIGGATLINGMMASRGFPSDYDRWAEDGNEGWSYNDLEKYFKKLENMTIDLDQSDQEYHNKSGPVSIEYSVQSPLGEKFLKAGKELGFDIIDDCNNPNTKFGFCINQGTLAKGKRQSAAAAYLHPIYRENLDVLKGALVTKINVNSKNYVESINYVKDGDTRYIYVFTELIIAAGGFGSPKLLMLNGIGPREHLEELDIPVLVDLPVGQNLLEHTGVPVTFLIDSEESYTLPKFMDSASDSFKQWLNGNKGLFSNMGLEALAYVNSSNSEDNPDIELIFLPMQLAGDGGIVAQEYMSISEEVYNKTWSEYNYQEGFLIAVMGMYPQSKGSVKLRSKDPNDPLIINANFLDNEQDVKTIIAGVRWAQTVANTSVFQEIGAKLNPSPVSGCESPTFDSDEYWECVTRRVLIHYHHQGGTCRMGQNGVVDERLKVKGINNLRVADTSIMPYLPGKHTMIPAYMIGEKAADLILEDHPTFY